ncbi:hypothetical protein PENSPDRAFT_652470 [Peniophora sp. CONT]|nr:hypothetical protein PENSPDRAFT_652470 [Peniophora sp. CONT]
MGSNIATAPATLPSWTQRVNLESVPSNYADGLNETSANILFAGLSTGAGYSKSELKKHSRDLRRQFRSTDSEHIIRPWIDLYLPRQHCGVNGQLWVYTHVLSELATGAVQFHKAEDDGTATEEDSKSWFDLIYGQVFGVFVKEIVGEKHFFDEHPIFVLSVLRLVQAMLDQYLLEIDMGFRKQDHSRCAEGVHGDQASAPDPQHKQLIRIVSTLSANAWQYRTVFTHGAVPDRAIPRATQALKKSMRKILMSVHHILPCTHNFVSEGRQDLCRLALHLWFHSDEDELDVAVPLLVFVFGHVMGRSPESDVLTFVSTDIIGTYGAKDFIARIPGFIQKNPPEQVSITFGYVFDSALKHPDFLPYLASSGTLGALRNMVDDQARKSDQTHQQLWDVTAYSLQPFTHCLKSASFEDGAYPLIRDIDFLSILSRTMILSAQSVNSNYGYCLDLCEACLTVFPAILNLSPKNKMRKMLKQSLARCWYRTLNALYSLQPDRSAERKLLRKHADIMAGWNALGNQAGFDVEQEKRDTQWRKKLCAWRDCLYFTTLPEEAPRTCKGCNEVAYCSTHCQNKDWKTGGHKAVCGKRLK